MDRRQLLVCGGSVLTLAVMPSAVIAAVTETFVPPATNIVHLAARIGQIYGFGEADVLKLFGLDPKQVMAAGEEPSLPRGPYDFLTEPYESAKAARLLAEGGAHDVYDRARLMIAVKRKLNLHFNFCPFDECAWMDSPNPRLQNKTFRQLMQEDLHHAEQVLDFALSK